jgi:rubredoxin
MNIYDCMACGFTYNEEQGSPANGIPPGTKWEDIDEDWLCPDCGASKAEFHKA